MVFKPSFVMVILLFTLLSVASDGPSNPLTLGADLVNEVLCKHTLICELAKDPPTSALLKNTRDVVERLYRDIETKSQSTQSAYYSAYFLAMEANNKMVNSLIAAVKTIPNFKFSPKTKKKFSALTQIELCDPDILLALHLKSVQLMAGPKSNDYKELQHLLLKEIFLKISPENHKQLSEDSKILIQKMDDLDNIAHSFIDDSDSKKKLLLKEEQDLLNSFNSDTSLNCFSKVIKDNGMSLSRWSEKYLLQAIFSGNARLARPGYFPAKMEEWAKKCSPGTEEKIVLCILNDLGYQAPEKKHCS